MDINRLLRHLFVTRWHVRHAFPPHTLRVIEKAVNDSHRAHIGQIRFAVEGALHVSVLLEGMSARERAIEVFSSLRIWDTEHNNGVLIYLLLADHDVEIVADRGVNAKVQRADWEEICRSMEADFRHGRYEAGVIRGIEQVTALLAAHFPARAGRNDELSGKTALL
jgi:uncharacterized membrane protein